MAHQLPARGVGRTGVARGVGFSVRACDGAAVSLILSFTQAV